MSRYCTPLRYPGGKQRLAPFILEILQTNDLDDVRYVEPYAGGAGVAMELLLGGHVSRVYLNDSSPHIYSFWRAVLDEPEEFCRRISRASLTISEWKRHREVVRQPDDVDLMDLGFSTFYLNRCNRSGVLSAGVIGGLQQRGRWRIDARFPRNELIRRVEAIADYRDAILPSNQDAEAFMRGKLRQLSESRTLVYCDPPYFERSQRLYPHSYDRADHERLAETIQTEVEHHWLVSYDGTPELMALYEARQMFVYSLQYSATRAYKGDEVFIFSDSLAIPSSSSHSSVNKGLLAAFG